MHHCVEGGVAERERGSARRQRGRAILEPGADVVTMRE